MHLNMVTPPSLSYTKFKYYKSVLYLSFFEDFTNEEVAKTIGKSSRQVRNLLYRAKLALKTELEKEGFNYEDY